MAESAITAQQAAAALSGLRAARDGVNYRAAGLAWMMWALVITSCIGGLLLLNLIPHDDMTNVAWGLYLVANIATVASWAGIGGLMQNAIWRAFATAPAMHRGAWRAPAQAFGVAFLLVASNLILQGVVQTLQGLGPEATRDQIHHNLGFAMAMGIGGAIVVAVTLLLGARGFRRAPGVTAGIAMLLLGHLTTFLWFPDLGVGGPLFVVVALPLAFLAMGSYVFRQG